MCHHDTAKIIDSIEGSEQAYRNALEQVAKHPNDPAAKAALEAATKQIDEIRNAQKIEIIKIRSEW